MTCTIVGGGVLSLPYAFYSAGLGMGLILLVFVGFVSGYTCILIVKAGKTAQKHTFGTLAEVALGKYARPLVCFLLIFLLFFSHIGYMVLLGDLVTPVIQELLPNAPHFLTSRAFIMFVCLALIFPCAFSKQLTVLQYSSLLGIIFIFVIAGTIIYRCFYPYNGGYTPIEWNKVEWVRGGSGPFLTLSLMGVSFLCHFSILPAYNDLKNNSTVKIGIVYIYKFIIILVNWLYNGNVRYSIYFSRFIWLFIIL